jgi:UDP-glucose/GDP-mannose dehydrogenase family, NAD binding domain
MRMSQRESEAGSAFSQVAANWAASSGMVMSAFTATFCAPDGYELGVAASAAGFGREASPYTKGIHQVDDKGTPPGRLHGANAGGDWMGIYSMRIVMVGAGYVGLVSGACLADFGHEVVCVEVDENKVVSLRQAVFRFTSPA